MKNKLSKNIMSLIIWGALLVIALISMPDTTKVVKEKGQITLPQSVQSNIAQSMGKRFDKSSANGTDIIAVFHSSKALTEEQNNTIRKSLSNLESEKQKLKISSITKASDNSETAKQVIAKDKTTQIATITLSSKDKLKSKSETIKSKLKVSGVDTYITGSDLLTEEFSSITEKGIQKTEIIAAVFIFVVLILVFRSPIVPLISLSTVGISLIVSLNIIMNLAKYFNFPISDFTQVFLVVVLFGIGTDYNILLYDQFKEELNKGLAVIEAAKEARKKAGKTILYSGVSVLIGFTVLSLAKFSFYQSAVGVAIGVCILLFNLLTFNLFFMKVLGPKMFWPSKNFDANSKSKFWNSLSNIAILRPLITLIVIGIIAIPFTFAYQNQQLNFNDADEIQNTNPIKKGYTIIQDHFSKGTVSPTTIYIENKTSLITKENLSVIDGIVEYMKKEKGVKQVASVTQPAGEKIKELYLKNQLQTLVNGLSDSKSGLSQITSGLKDANTQLTNSDVNGQLQSVQTLANGARSLADGSQKLASGTKEYTNGVDTLTGGVSQLDEANKQLSSSFSQVVSGSDTLTKQVQALKTQVDSLNTMKENLGNIISQVPGLNEQVNLSQMENLREYYNQLNTGVTQLNTALNQINSNLPTLTSSSTQLVQGSQELNTSGQQLSDSANDLASGSSQVNGGVQELNTQLKTLGTQVNQLSEGLSTTSSGIKKVQDGLVAIQKYLNEMKSSYLGNNFYVPSSVLNSKDLDESYNIYMSDDRKMTQINLVLDEDPSTLSAAQKLTTIESDVKARLKGTSLSNAKIAFGGQTSQTADLENLANKDFTRTAIIMIIGIGIALIFITNSVIQPISIILTLLITFVTSLGITRVISTVVLGKDLLTWNTPFFTFIMLVALGVDYSIFLMMKYKENRLQDNMDEISSIRKASLVIGVVVLSAALILGGTFAALIPSGVTTLIQVALGVITGLILLIFLLPLVISAVIKLSQK